MKTIIIALILLCFVSKADSRVTRKDVKDAKHNYLCAKQRLRFRYNNWNERQFESACQQCICPGEFNDVTQDLVSIDSLTWRVLKQIRRDQLNPFIIKIYCR